MRVVNPLKNFVNKLKKRKVSEGQIEYHYVIPLPKPEGIIEKMAKVTPNLKPIAESIKRNKANPLLARAVRAALSIKNSRLEGGNVGDNKKALKELANRTSKSLAAGKSVALKLKFNMRSREESGRHLDYKIIAKIQPSLKNYPHIGVAHFAISGAINPRHSHAQWEIQEVVQHIFQSLHKHNIRPEGEEVQIPPYKPAESRNKPQIVSLPV